MKLLHWMELPVLLNTRQHQDVEWRIIMGKREQYAAGAGSVQRLHENMERSLFGA